jgi:hypothetical protein
MIVGICRNIVRLIEKRSTDFFRKWQKGTLKVFISGVFICEVDEYNPIEEEIWQMIGEKGVRIVE